MGGEPLFALVTLALPPETDVAVPDDLYAGLMECATEYGVTIAGGDIVRASELSITIALIGRAQMQDGEPLLMRRDAAKAGDLVAVTGSLGDSAAGLWRLRKGATGGGLARPRAPPPAPEARGRAGSRSSGRRLRDRRLGRTHAGPRPHLRALRARRGD